MAVLCRRDAVCAQSGVGQRRTSVKELLSQRERAQADQMHFTSSPGTACPALPAVTKANWTATRREGRHKVGEAVCAADVQTCGGEEVMFEIARGAGAQTTVVIRSTRLARES
jgi:hypothetical protein